MKLVTLNLWGGRLIKPLEEFLKKHSGQIDVFCFQEVFHGTHEDEISDLLSGISKGIVADLYERIIVLLPGYKSLFLPVFNGVYGLAIFVKSDIDMLSDGNISLYKTSKFPDPDNPGADHDRSAQWANLQIDGKAFKIINVHGHWTGIDKKDNENRLRQSSIIKELLDSETGPKILCGDFNLRPDTESIKMLEGNMNNLVTKYGVTSTRTSAYNKSEKFADYIFTSPEIEVKDFKVLSDEPSDHSPLYLEFEII